MEKIMTNGLSNFEVLKQKISTSPKDNFLKGQQPRVGEVLIVDDEESFVLSLAEGLSVYRKFFNLRTAPNGAEAVKVLKLSAIDLVITDLSMPKMDGFELLAYMNRTYPKITVILMTAYGTPKIEEIVSNMGIFRYLEKPLDINAIADNIFDALGIKTSSISEEIQKTDSRYKPSATPAPRTSFSSSGVQNKIALAKKASEEEKKSTTDEEKQAAEAAEKRALLEAKAKAEAERFAREEAELKIKEAEERAKQETLAREEAQRKTRDAEERAKQEAELNAKEAQTQLTDKTQKDLKKETQQKLSAWKKG